MCVSLCHRLVSGAGDIKLTKDGNVLLHEMVSTTQTSLNTCLTARKIYIIYPLYMLSHIDHIKLFIYSFVHAAHYPI
jgi:hypothetical protein